VSDETRKNVETFLEKPDVQLMLKGSLSKGQTLYFNQSPRGVLTQVIDNFYVNFQGSPYRKNGFAIILDMDWNNRPDEINLALLEHEIGHVALENSGLMPVSHLNELYSVIANNPGFEII